MPTTGSAWSLGIEMHVHASSSFLLQSNFQKSNRPVSRERAPTHTKYFRALSVKSTSQSIIRTVDTSINPSRSTLCLRCANYSTLCSSDPVNTLLLLRACVRYRQKKKNTRLSRHTRVTLSDSVVSHNYDPTPINNEQTHHFTLTVEEEPILTS